MFPVKNSRQVQGKSIIAVQVFVGVTSQNAATSGELEFSSEELARQSDQLKEFICFFKLK